MCVIAVHMQYITPKDRVKVSECCCVGEKQKTQLGRGNLCHMQSWLFFWQGAWWHYVPVAPQPSSQTQPLPEVFHHRHGP